MWVRCEVTIIAAAIIFSFTTIEFLDYRRVNVDTSIVVDRSRGEKLTVNMNVTFPRVPCYRECPLLQVLQFGATKSSTSIPEVFTLCRATHSGIREFY